MVEKRESKLGLLTLRSEIVLGIVVSSVIILTFVILVDTFGIPFTSFKGSYGNEKADALRLLSLVADSKKERLETWLNDAKGDTTVLAERNAVRLSGMKSQQREGNESHKQPGSDLVPQEAIQHEDHPVVAKLFSDFVTTYQRYSKIQMVDGETGRVLVSSKQDEQGKTVGSLQSFQNALKSRDQVNVTVEIGPLEHRTFVVLSKIVRYDDPRREQNVAAPPVILLYVDMEKLLRPMLYVGEGMGKSGEILLVSQDTKALMSLKYPLADGSVAKVLDYRIAALPARLAAQGQEGTIETDDYRGMPVIACCRFIRISEDQGWGMVVKQDRSEIFAPLRSRILYTSIIGIVGICFAGILARAIGRRISEPIDSLSETAREVAAGNSKIGAAIYGPPEIRSLAQTFNTMVDRLRGWYDALEMEVELRTAQLAKLNDDLRTEIEMRKKVELGLKASEQRYRFLYEKTPVPLHSVNESLEIIYVSDYWLDLLGYTREEVIGRSPLDFFAGESRLQAEAASIPAAWEKGIAQDVSFQMVKKDGEVIDVLFSTIAQHDPDGKFIQSLAAFYDVTALRSAEEALKKAHDELELRVRERTADLENTNLELSVQIEQRKRIEGQLRSALVDLSLSNKELSQFAYVSSHDLQEPLRNVAHCAQMLERKYGNRLGPEGNQIIQYAVEASKRSIQLIHDLLNYSRVGTRGMPLEPVEVEEILALCLSDLRVQIEESGATIFYDSLPGIVADRIQIRLLFQNLLSNAMKFRGSDPPRIHISSDRTEGFWRFCVKDNGIGIKEEYFDRIFVIFQRLHSTEKYPGTGIGLAIAKKIVERHGGKIWVRSVVGEGSTFCFTIPTGGVPVRRESHSESEESDHKES
ncbi:MAG: PAS domain S-box protein [Desulfomonile tiedjei]|nr:PAS domain S-box protein [Desulfomonile tiedjei]